MNAIEELFSQLQKLDIQLWADGEKLRYSAPQGTLTPELKEQLKVHKSVLIGMLSQSKNVLQDDLKTISIVSRNQLIPLSFAQQRLWFLHQLEPESIAYNLSFALHITGNFSIETLERSLNEVVQRHEILRTTFPSINGKPTQKIHEAQKIYLSPVDLKQLSITKHPKTIDDFIKEAIQHTFDLASGPLLKVNLLQLADDSFIFILIMHHIITDGWSMGIFIREVLSLYENFSKGQAPTLPDLQIQYADFASWQRQRLKGRFLNGKIEYWKQKLSQLPPLLELPLDRPRPPVQSYRGDSLEFEVDSQLTQKLKVFSQKSGNTLFMMLLSAFAVLVMRYSKYDDIAIGSPIAGRKHRNLESLIGFFVNTLVLRINFRKNQTFSQLLKRVQQTALEAYYHQDMPFEKLVEILQPERNMSHSPLFQVMFALQNVPTESLELPDLTITRLPIEDKTTQFDLMLSINENSRSLQGKFIYSTDLFESTTISRMIGHFQILLQSIIDNPHQHIATLPILPQFEEEKILKEWNKTDVNYSLESCLHHLIETQVKRTPEAIALIFDNQQLTYKELNCKANQLAHYLRKRGVGAEVLVGIYVERSLYMLIGLLGILKAGAAYVPLDPIYPKERIALMLEDSEVSVLITQTGLQEELPECQTHIICLDGDWETIAREDKQNITGSVNPDNLAYVIYTSGSTGTPKGVQICHRSLVNFLHSMQVSPGLTQNDILLAVTTISFDIAALELYLPLIAGARIVLVGSEVASDGVQLIRKLDETQATVMQATPATWRILLASGWQGKETLKILCGGEALPQELAIQLLPKCFSLWNMYGPTETTIWSTIYHVEPTQSDMPVKETALSIGRPIANTQIYILDDRLQPVPIGVAGELHIGGDGLARGYRNRPELNAEKFISDPFSAQPEARLYKTGDLARYLADGNIEYLGRLDHQVKIRGFRIELGDIEAALLQYTPIRESVAIVREDRPNDKRLVGYLVLQPNQICDTSKLRHYLKEKLPDYMIPSAFVMLEELPLTPNGKVNRRALTAPKESERDLQKGYVAPRTPIETTLADIWADVLHVKQAGIYDNFFELGGHSLLATQILSRIRDGFDIELPLRTLFQLSNISELAEFIAMKQLEKIDEETLQQILAETSELSDEEVARQLFTDD